MLDFTDERHKRGFMILSSKDVRIVDRTLFDWNVQSKCAFDYLDLIERRLNKEKIDADDIEDMKMYLKFVRNHYIEVSRFSDECRKVFM